MNENKIEYINDSELENISGGAKVVTKSTTTYKSGRSPKFNVGDNVTLVFKPDKGGNRLCFGKILAVNPDKCYGFTHSEFGYTVQIVGIGIADAALNEEFVGRIYENVHESCLS